MPENPDTLAPLSSVAYDREQIRRQIEDATGEGLSVDDPTPDTLAAAAEAIGLAPHDLRAWIHETPKLDWSARALLSWAARYGLGSHAAANCMAAPDDAVARLQIPCGECGELIADAAAHFCAASQRSEAEA